jgi:hypothetical protein
MVDTGIMRDTPLKKAVVMAEVARKISITTTTEFGL